MTNEAGQVVAGYEYDPYGNPIGEQESGYGYTGEFWQSELGLLHLRARWYDPSTGTFLSKDRVESEPPYQYVRGNPVNYVDPSGHTFKLPCPLCDKEFDVTDWPDWAKGAVNWTVCLAADCHVDYENNLLKTQTRREYEESVALGGLYDPTMGMSTFATITGKKVVGEVVEECSARLSKDVTHYLTNIGDDVLEHNANILAQFGDDAVFSAVWDSKTGKFLAIPSGDTILKNGVKPYVVNPHAGHRIVRDELFKMLDIVKYESIQAHKRAIAGFTMFREGVTGIRVHWKSTSINQFVNSWGTASPLVNPIYRNSIIKDVREGLEHAGYLVRDGGDTIIKK